MPLPEAGEDNSLQLLGWTEATATPQVEIALRHPKMALIANALGTPPADMIDHIHAQGRKVAALWRNVSRPVAGDGRWIALEHELWRYAARNEAARERLARRYRAAWAGIDAAWARPGASVAPAVMGTLLGLEMMRRIDPGAITDQLAVETLRGVVLAGQTDRRPG